MTNSENPDAALRKHEIISRDLRREIAAGKYGDNGQLPSEAQLVKRFGASRPTVARALRTLVGEHLVERRVGSGTYVIYKTEAQGMPEAREVGLLIPDLEETEIFQLIWGEIATVARSHHYSVMWGAPLKRNSDPLEMEREGEQLCRQFIDRRVTGVFFAPSHKLGDANRRLVEMLRKAGIPLVLLDKDLGRFPTHGEFDVASIDNVTGGHILTEHLWKLGYRKFNFVSPSAPAPSIQARIAGVREALLQFGAMPDSGLVRFGDVSHRVFVKQLIGLQPDALICSNDKTAATLLQTLSSIGIRVPDDVTVTGFDDINIAPLVTPPLTTVQQPAREIAQVAFSAMLERQSNARLPARHLSIAPRLVIRSSCGTYLRSR